MSRLRVGVAGRTGAGNYGHQLDLAFTADPRAEIVAVSDVAPEPARERAALLGAERAYVDYGEMLQAEDLDIVVVAPRHMDCRLDMVELAVKRGAHVYCEKPLAQSLAMSDAIVESAKTAGKFVGQALPFVHESRFALVQRLLAAPEFGDLVQMRGLCKWDYRGGGQDFLILGVHFADMMRRFAGDPSACRASVTACGSPISANDVTDGAEASGLVAGDRIHAAYTFPGGVHGTIESWRVGIEDRGLQPYRLELKGTRGQIMVRAPYADHSVWTHPLPEFVPGGPAWEQVETEVMLAYGDYHRRAARDFLDALEEGRQPLCSAEDGRAALEMIHAAFAAQLSRTTVSLPLAVREHPLASLVGR